MKPNDTIILNQYNEQLAKQGLQRIDDPHLARKATILYEIQHAIGTKENASRGASHIAEIKGVESKISILRGQIWIIKSLEK